MLASKSRAARLMCCISTHLIGSTTGPPPFAASTRPTTMELVDTPPPGRYPLTQILYRSFDRVSTEGIPGVVDRREGGPALMIIDADSHVCEPPDTWTSRMPSKWGELIPRVKRVEALGADVWCIGDE